MASLLIEIVVTMALLATSSAITIPMITEIVDKET